MDTICQCRKYKKIKRNYVDTIYELSKNKDRFYQVKEELEKLIGKNKAKKVLKAIKRILKSITGFIES